MGYRLIRDTLEHDYNISVNDKRVSRVCRKKKIQSHITHKYNCCTKPATDPAYIAENILNRDFKSDIPNEKWLTDVSTSKAFRQKIIDAGMIQRMSRVAKCIDNGPMEGFWVIMKREMYHGKKYKTKDELIEAIEEYIDYYTNKRVQRNFCVLTPQEIYEKRY